ncbi:glycosyltransferase [Streptomyces sp. LUP30]|uniref:glycosyltransferase n=1 Tax=Streptomyces sp. LUP30 TaxID=1890285 RepID=UPI0008521073|nr:glycosyltransferase [Streptomyces sp. LUP30]
MRVGIDCRRIWGNGVSRLTRDFVGGLIDGAPEFDLVLFGDRGELGLWAEQGAEVCDYPLAKYSERDIHGLPLIIEAARVDSFLALQYYVSPLIPCRHIRFLHDTYPFMDGVPLATLEEWRLRYGERDLGLLLTYVRERMPASTSGQEPDVQDVYRVLYAEGVERADVVLSVSDSSARRLRELFPAHAAKINTVYPFASSKFHDASGWKGPFDAPWQILHIGNFEPRRNQLSLLQAVESMYRCGVPVTLTLVGRSTGNYRDYAAQVHAAIGRGVAGGWINYHYWISDDELIDAYCRSAVLVVPSWCEGFGLPVLEALTLGVPVVAVRSDTLQEVCDTAARWSEPSAESLARTLTAVLSEPSIQRGLSQAALRQSSKYQRDVTVDRLRLALRGF